jgi:hypothetical protein
VYQILFIIHGMGAGARPVNDPDWWTTTVADLRRYAQPYGHDRHLVLTSPKAGDILVVPLSYHSIFDDIRTKWTAQTGSEVGWLPLLQQLAFNPAMMARVPGWVTTAGKFFWTHVLDVLLYRFVNEFTTPVRDEVAFDIGNAWAEADQANDANTPVHFLSHSLGTAVLHDALGVLSSDPGFGTGTHRITSMLTCANVSSVLENGFPTYAGRDRTVNCPPRPGGMTAAYFSYRHQLDPIAAVKPFDGAVHGWPASEYLGSVPTEVKDWNVHGYSHYLDHPDAHLRLFERLWPRENWAARRPAEMIAYQQLPGTPCPAAIAVARAKLSAIIARPRPENEVEFIEVIVETVRVIQDAAKACQSEQGQ